MATPEELFISFPQQTYRRSKSAVLLSQSELLHSLKHLQNIKVLSRQKNDLRLQLYKSISSIILQINSLQSKMPTPKIPKTVSRPEDPKPKSKQEAKIQAKIVPTKRDEIEEELKLIQAKLQELNS